MNTRSPNVVFNLMRPHETFYSSRKLLLLALESFLKHEPCHRTIVASASAVQKGTRPSSARYNLYCTPISRVSGPDAKIIHYNIITLSSYIMFVQKQTNFNNLTICFFFIFINESLFYNNYYTKNTYLERFPTTRCKNLMREEKFLILFIIERKINYRLCFRF